MCVRRLGDPLIPGDIPRPGMLVAAEPQPQRSLDMFFRLFFRGRAACAAASKSTKLGIRREVVAFKVLLQPCQIVKRMGSPEAVNPEKSRQTASIQLTYINIELADLKHPNDAHYNHISYHSQK